MMLICSSFIILLKSREEEKSVFGSGTFFLARRQPIPLYPWQVAIDRLKFLNFIYMRMNGRFFGFNIERDGRGGEHKYMYDKKSVK